MPCVSVQEEEAVTTLTVGFENEESIWVFFFPEPETIEEAALQKPWRAMQKLFQLCIDCEHECEGCRLAQSCILTLMGALLLGVLIPVAGIVTGILGLGINSIFIRRWYVSRHVRARKKRTASHAEADSKATL